MNFTFPVALAFTVCLATTGCPGSGDTESPAEPVTEALYFEPIGAGQAGSLTDTTEVLVSTVEHWDSLRDSLRSPVPFGAVDFFQTMIMVAALPQSSGGFRIQFESVEKEGDRITASYVVFAPGPDCITPMAMTLPYQAIAVRRAAGHVEFRRRTVLESCALD